MILLWDRPSISRISLKSSSYELSISHFIGILSDSFSSALFAKFESRYTIGELNDVIIDYLTIFIAASSDVFCDYLVPFKLFFGFMYLEATFGLD